MHFGLTRVLANTVSALVVLAAFGAGFRYLAGRRPGRAPGLPRLRLPGPRGTITVSLSRAVARVVVLAARFASGAPLGRRRTDATFLSAGTRALAGVPGWFTTAEPCWWAFWPGWKRAAVRWAAVAAAAGLDTHPLITGAVLGWLALLTGLALAPRWRRWWYVRAVIRPIYLQLAQYLGTDPADKPDRWLDIPPGFTASQDAVITLAYPATWNPDAARQNHIDQLIRRHCGADLVASFGAFQATWAHPPAPPQRAPFEGYDLPAHRIHLATLAGGTKWVADLQDEEPHLFIAAGTGGGKTATASVPAAHVRANGWLVDIIDPKRRSYIDRKTGKDVLTNVPGIRVHTDIESMMWALEEFFLSMLGVNIAVGERAAWPGAFPHRLLVIDEFGTFAGMAARMHRRAGCGPGRSARPTAPGSPPLLLLAWFAAGELAELGEVDLRPGAGLLVVGGGDQAQVVDAGGVRLGRGGLRHGPVHVPAGDERDRGAGGLAVQEHLDPVRSSGSYRSSTRRPTSAGSTA